MTTPKEALEQAVSFARQVACIEGVRHAPEMKAIAEQYQGIFEQALASIEGDAVERVARMFDPEAFEDDRLTWEDRRVRALNRARRILATGLVPDESTIRADEREKCARIAEDDERQDEWPKSVDVNRTSPSRIMQQTIAAAIRSGGGE